MLPISHRTCIVLVVPVVGVSWKNSQRHEIDMKICIETEVKAPLGTVWDAWVTPKDITSWNFAVDEWWCPRVELTLEVGGKFNYRMEARDGSTGFDFEGTFTKLEPRKYVHFQLDDSRVVKVEFIEAENGVRILETFDAEDENSADQQKQGWQSILNNFKKHVEKTATDKRL